MSIRIDKHGNRTRPHACGRNCPKDHVHDNDRETEFLAAIFAREAEMLAIFEGGAEFRDGE